MRLLILNGDLPTFPGRAGHEYLHTTGLARLGETVGLVSLVHDAEQEEKQQELALAGVRLHLWRSPSLWSRPLKRKQPSPTPVPQESTLTARKCRGGHAC